MCRFGFHSLILNVFDIMQVKSVRETMNHLIEAWKAIPDVQEEVLTPRESQSSSKGMKILLISVNTYFFY